MATGTVKWSCVSSRNTNFTRLCKLLIDGGTKVLRDLFDSYFPPHSLGRDLLQPGNRAILKNLHSKKILGKEQWNRLYPTGGSTVDSTSFDITLLCLLLRSICNLPTPIGGWKIPPGPTSTNREDDVVRIKLYRNELYGHTAEPALSDADFNQHWDNIASVLLRLGGAQTDIDDLKVASMDPVDETYYIQCMEEWDKNDERIMKALEATEEKLAQKMDNKKRELAEKIDEGHCKLRRKLDDTSVQVTERMDSTKRELAEKIDEVHCKLRKLDESSRASVPDTSVQVTERMDSTKKELAEKIDHQAERMDEVHRKLGEIESTLQASSRATVPDTRVQDAELFSQKLKRAVQNKLQSQKESLISPLLEKMRLEDIFTKLLMYQGRKEKSKSSQSDLLGGMTSREIQNIEDVFVDNTKSILIKGNAGIGKSLFSRKLIQDWATNCILNQKESADNPVIKFAFLLTFRQLNMLAEKETSLSELLKEFSMLDENVDDSVIEYIMQHPKQLFILIDGYDEYMDKERNKMNNQYFESSFPDNPNSKMPVAALVSKLIKNKILPSSVVIVTSRPGEAEELKNVHFDRYVDILGYSEEQVLEYVTKYFNSDNEMQSKALSNIKDNQEFLKFGRTPLMSLLMCVYIENNLTNASECFPKTLSSFYTEVIKCIEKNYNKEIQKDNLDEKTTTLVVKKMKDNMAVLAAESLVRGKYSFNEEDFTKLNISERELTYLKCSSLLFCESSVRKSGLSSEVVHEYSFNHTTFHEYFTAWYFVKMNELPAEIHLSGIILQFMAGLMDPVQHKQLMQQVLQHIYKIKVGLLGRVQRSVLLTCLYEFGDETFVKQLVQQNKHNRYWDSSRGGIYLVNIDYKVVVWFVDILTLLNNKEQSLSSSSPVPHWLYILRSPLTLLGVEKLFKSLANTSCCITELGLLGCNIDDECCEYLCRYVPNTKLTRLILSGNNITNKSVSCIVECCSQLTHLHLVGNNITNIEQVRVLFTDKNPHLVLHIK